jgi:hypothetical protein
MKTISLAALVAAQLVAGAAQASETAEAARRAGLQALRSMTGCYLVDYSYTETESLREGYERDNRVYDVNTNKSIKEWIYAEEVSENRVRLQHILFGTDLEGNLMDGSELKHQAEDWEFNAPFLYEFDAPRTWSIRDLSATPELWTRRITNLDDGLRYQCAAAWSQGLAYSEWTCDNYAPIPGRETRDMSRRDYDTLQRGTRLVAYGNSWLERQNNVKTIHDNGNRTPLARELGKNWYVRLPDSECASAQAFAEPRIAFWSLLREIWDEVLSGDRPFVERATTPGQPNRYVQIMGIEERYVGQNLQDPAIRAAAKAEVIAAIEAFREN